MSTASRAAIVLAAALALSGCNTLVDPLAPNWTGEVQRLSEDTYRITLHMKRFKRGGDGEATRAFHRNAGQIVRENGFEDYTVLSLTEGIESETTGAVRYAEGIIRVSRAR